MEILNRDIEGYLEGIWGERGEVLSEMEELGEERDFPIVGPLVGRLLFQLTRLLKAKRVLELGSGFGYSAFWFAQAIDTSEAEIVLTEFDPDNLKLAQSFLSKGGLKPRFRFLQGDALRRADELEGEFDLIFNDVDKEDYPAAFELAHSRLRPGGLLISDNVLWSGKVVDTQPDAATQAIQRYNQIVFAHPEYDTTIVPLRDGIAISLRK